MNADAPLALLVEDDQSLRESLAMALEHKGYRVLQAPTGEESLRLVDSDSPDVILLDINLPGIDGLEVCNLLRQRRYAGKVLMLTARGELSDTVVGLDAGADDYLSKPFALDELLARLRALTRHIGSPNISTRTDDHVQVADLHLHRASRRVSRGGADITLTRIEFDLLELMMANVEMVMTRELIHTSVWGHDAEYGSNSLQVFISGLRRKIAPDGQDQLIHTVRGIGYVIRQPL